MRLNPTRNTKVSGSWALPGALIFAAATTGVTTTATAAETAAEIAAEANQEAAATQSEDAPTAEQKFHSYHNTLGGVMIATPGCETAPMPGDANARSVLDVADANLRIRTDARSFWKYDGARMWQIGRVSFFGNFRRYQDFEGGCVVYTNSFTVKSFFNHLTFDSSPWWTADLFSVERTSIQ